MAGRHQRGQAIVLIALIFAVLCGMVALVVDGGHLYMERRHLQDAVDSAALTAADTYQNPPNSYSTAETNGIAMFAKNAQASTAGCSPSTGGPPITLTCSNWPRSGESFTMTVTTSTTTAGTQSSFQVTATRWVTVGLAAAAGGAGTVSIGATATTVVSPQQMKVPAILTLGNAGCPGASGNSLTIQGNPNLTVKGDVVSDGSIYAAGSVNVNVAGNVKSRCGSISSLVQTYCIQSGAPPPCTAPDVQGTKTTSAPAQPDPAYPAPNVGGLTTRTLNTNVVLLPGIYSSGSPSTNYCYFLSPGIYDWTGGFAPSGGFFSNELKPPDEPVYNNNTSLASPQFWNSNSHVSCAGSFSLVTVSDTSTPVLPVGTWAIEVTAVRTETLNGVSYVRESAPSLCRTVSVSSNNDIRVTVNNVPGAQKYYVYASPPPGGCSGPFGYIGSITYTGTQVQSSLGSVIGTFDGTAIPNPFNPSPTIEPDTRGAYPPSGATAPLGSGLPNEVPARAAPPNGDRADENQCADTAGQNQSCAGPITPGAVQFYVPSGGCFSPSGNGSFRLFSGYQYNWISLYEPVANTCNNSISGNYGSTMTGMIYTPGATFTFTGTSTTAAPVLGGVVVKIGIVTGTSGLTIAANSNYDPNPPSARLTQ